MKKMLFTIMLITGLFSQSNMTFIGGINYSKVTGDSIVKDAESLMGYRFGVQKNLENGLIGGLTYSQRGFSLSEEEDSDYYYYYYYGGPDEIEVEFKVNYLTAYILKPFPQQSGFDLLGGMEVGYFWGGEY